MADNPTTTQLLTLSQTYRGDVVRQINRTCSTLKMIPMKRGEGKNIAWAPEADGAIAENYSEGADATNFGGDSQASAFLTWALYRSNFHVTQLAMDTAATSQSPTGNKQAWARQLVNGSAKLAALINSEFWAGPGTGTRMAGMGVAIDASNTYATIDRSQSGNSYFRSTVIDPGTATELTFELIRDDLRLVYEACGEVPDCAAVSPAVFNKVGGLFDKTRRQVDTVHGGAGMVKLEFGFQALEVDGTVFFRDKDVTAQQIFYLNRDHVWIEILPFASQEALIEAAGFDVAPDDGFGQVPLNMKYEMLAKNGASDRAEVLWQGNAVLDRPNTCAVRKNVAVLG